MKNKIYFVSDVHLGVPNYEDSLIREKHFISWLNFAEKDAAEIYILGDLFDFWFEYRRAIPKYFTRLLGKLAQMSDNGINIHFLVGNHDLWTFGYLSKEIGLNIHKKSIEIERDGKKIFLAHGDGLGKKDYGYKFLKIIFTNPFAQWLFSIIHPDFGIYLAQISSKRSRYSNEKKVNKKYDRERLYDFAQELAIKYDYDYILMGHRHLPMKKEFSAKNTYINLGDWIHHFSYAVMEDSKIDLKVFK